MAFPSSGKLAIRKEKEMRIQRIRYTGQVQLKMCYLTAVTK